MSYRDEELPLVEGCVYVTGIGHKGKVPFKIFCHKLVAEGSEYCPKHKIYVEDLAEARNRKAEQRRQEKEQRKNELAALALSPLRANNPCFEKRETGYEK